MDYRTGIILVVGILIVVLLIGTMKNRTEWILNLILRGLSGMMLIYFYNYTWKDWLGGTELGYNFVTFLTSAFLGIPGVAMLFGINLYMNL